MSEFRLKVEQFDDEPAWSVLYRLARLSGAGDAKQFCMDWDMDLTGIQNGNEIEGFARRGGYDLDLFERNTIRTLDWGFEINGEKLFGHSVTGGQNRVCRRCLEEDVANGGGRPDYRPHWRDWWFIRSVSACPFHGIRITAGEKAAFGGRISYSHVNPMLGDLDGSSITRTPIVEVGDTQWEVYVLGRIRFMPRRSHWLLDRYPLGYAIALVRKVGEAVLEAAGHQDPTDADPYDIHYGGYRALRSRETLEALLDGLFQAATVRGGKWGQRVVYGALYDWLNQSRQERSSGALYDHVRTILFEHAWRTFPLNPKEEFFGTTLPERNFYTLHHVWRESGIHTSRLRAILLKLGIIDEAMAALTNDQIFIKAEDARTVVETLRRSMTQNELKARYGIPRGTFAIIQDAGLMPSWLQTGPTSEGDHIHLEQDVDAWFARLKGAAPFVDRVEPGMASLMNITGIVKTTVDKVIIALQAGDLKCRGVLDGEKEWSSIVVSVREAKDLFSDKSGDGFLSLMETIERLRMSHAVVRALVDQGHLVKHDLKSRTGLPKACFAPADLDQFDSTYISMKEARAHIGAHERVQQPLLANAGIEPAFDLKISPASAFYRREDIEKLPKDCFRSERSKRNLRKNARESGG